MKLFVFTHEYVQTPMTFKMTNPVRILVDDGVPFVAEKAIFKKLNIFSPIKRKWLKTRKQRAINLIAHPKTKKIYSSPCTTNVLEYFLLFRGPSFPFRDRKIWEKSKCIYVVQVKILKTEEIQNLGAQKYSLFSCS